MSGSCLAIDIGGTKFAAGIVDRQGRICARGEAPTPDSRDPEVLFSVLASLIERVITASDTTPQVCGVGCGGPMESGGRSISPLNIPGWRSFPLQERLSAATGLQVQIDNDAKALALGEGWLGAAQNSSSYLAMVVSTGIGGGIVLDGRLLDGRTGNAGHLGHLVVVEGGRLCRCGVRGCLEAEASGTAIAEISGRPASEAGSEIITRTAFLVGKAVASVVALLDLDLCVVAGSVALGFGERFFDEAQRSMDEHLGLEYARGARIIPAGLGGEGPLVGAAAVGLFGSGILVDR